jgi:hypothetical protein
MALRGRGLHGQIPERSTKSCVSCLHGLSGNVGPPAYDVLPSVISTDKMQSSFTQLQMPENSLVQCIFGCWGFSMARAGQCRSSGDTHRRSGGSVMGITLLAMSPTTSVQALAPFGVEVNLYAAAFAILWFAAFAYTFYRAFKTAREEGAKRRRARMDGEAPEATEALARADGKRRFLRRLGDEAGKAWLGAKHVGNQVLWVLVTYRVPLLGAALILLPWLYSGQLRESYRSELVECLHRHDIARYMEFHVALIAVFLNISMFMAGPTRLLWSRLQPGRPVETIMILFAPPVYAVVCLTLFSFVVLDPEFGGYHATLLANGLPLKAHFLRNPGRAIFFYLFLFLLTMTTFQNVVFFLRFRREGKVTLPRANRLQRLVALSIGLGFIGWGILGALAGPPSPNENFVTRIVLNISAPHENPVTEIFYSLSLWISLLFFATSRFRMPALELAVVAGLVWSFFDLNDNHAVRTLKSRAPGAELVTSVERWFEKRPDIDLYREAPFYPVYVVAAEGGGIYAAVHTAVVLSRLQDARPVFRDHIFAISAVSGGGLGAAVFKGLIERDRRCEASVDCRSAPRKSLEERALRVLGTDFLTPLLHATLRTDLVQRVLPWPIEALDRARGLETAFEKSWERLGADRSLPNPMQASSFGTDSDDGPYLFLNATEVETGSRVVISPFSLKLSSLQTGAVNLKAFADEVPGVDLALSTAVGLSARFPFITPAAWYEVYESDYRVKRRLVDGGYFDNSGIETALDLIRALDLGKERLKSRFKLRDIRFILLSISSREDDKLPTGSRGLGELLTPYRTMMSSWRARTEATVAAAARYLNGSLGAPTDSIRMRRLILHPDERGLPLGWHLSSETIDNIARWSAGSECRGTRPERNDLNDLNQKRTESDCAFHATVGDLVELPAPTR